MKLDLLTNATVVDDGIRFVTANREFASKLDSIGLNRNMK